MFSSEVISPDMRRSGGFLHSDPRNQSNFKYVSAVGEFSKSREFMGSEFYQNQNQHHQNQGGLARYRSAPSSFLAALLDSTTDNSSSGDECEAFFSALMDGPGDPNQKNNENQMQFSMKQEVGSDLEAEPRCGENGQVTGYGSAVNGGGGAVVGSYSVGNGNKSNCANLVRQSSSPAGFFNGFGVMGEVGNYRVHNHAEAGSSAGGLSNHMNYSSCPSSSSMFMPSIPETDNESFGRSTTENGRLRNGNSASCGEYEPEPSLHHDSWNQAPFNNSLKRDRDGHPKMYSDFSGLEDPNGETRKKPLGLVHHMSLPRTTSEMAAGENYLQFGQDTTARCQVRAKRGCATHPRSIAERMRRTRISEKMKKLQDLFPNMDKQTNTAEMLELAVEYIKNLQKQVQTLTDTRAKCVCSSKLQLTSPTT
ncbi:transcription factor bHLH130-like [Sesamum indicum]|uniref:Transcription factor bHLH130-like n=1 Tax=Sesamum indicum TaxID=4182 RepID=A0A6I9U0N1_SESIN|nr:transcription factor bHLH130-like [Sesamum indicum]